MLLLTINRKPFIASPMPLSNLTFTDLERSKSMSLRFSVVGHLYRIDIFAIWMSQQGVCWRAGFSAVPGVFLVYECVSLGPYQVNRWTISQGTSFLLRCPCWLPGI